MSKTKTKSYCCQEKKNARGKKIGLRKKEAEVKRVM